MVPSLILRNIILRNIQMKGRYFGEALSIQTKNRTAIMHSCSTQHVLLILLYI